MKELKAAMIQVAYVMACESVFLFLTKKSDAYSRSSFLFCFFYPVIMYIGRYFWKKFLNFHGRWLQNEKSILLLASEDIVEEFAVHIEERCVKPVQILGIALAENRKNRKQISSYPVVAVGEKDILRFVQNAWVDEIVVKITRESPDTFYEKV